MEEDFGAAVLTSPCRMKERTRESGRRGSGGRAWLNGRAREKHQDHRVRPCLLPELPGATPASSQPPGARTCAGKCPIRRPTPSDCRLCRRWPPRGDALRRSRQLPPIPVRVGWREGVRIWRFTTGERVPHKTEGDLSRISTSTGR